MYHCVSLWSLLVSSMKIATAYLGRESLSMRIATAYLGRENLSMKIATAYLGSSPCSWRARSERLFRDRCTCALFLSV